MLGYKCSHIADPIQILQHGIKIIEETTIKRLNTKLSSGAYSVGIGGIIINVE